MKTPRKICARKLRCHDYYFSFRIIFVIYAAIIFFAIILFRVTLLIYITITHCRAVFFLFIFIIFRVTFLSIITLRAFPSLFDYLRMLLPPFTFSQRYFQRDIFSARSILFFLHIFFCAHESAQRTEHMRFLPRRRRLCFFFAAIIIVQVVVVAGGRWQAAVGGRGIFDILN